MDKINVGETMFVNEKTDVCKSLTNIHYALTDDSKDLIAMINMVKETMIGNDGTYDKFEVVED